MPSVLSPTFVLSDERISLLALDSVTEREVARFALQHNCIALARNGGLYLSGPCTIHGRLCSEFPVRVYNMTGARNYLGY